MLKNEDKEVKVKKPVLAHKIPEYSIVFGDQKPHVPSPAEQIIQAADAAAADSVMMMQGAQPYKKQKLDVVDVVLDNTPSF